MKEVRKGWLSKSAALIAIGGLVMSVVLTGCGGGDKTGAANTSATSGDGKTAEIVLAAYTVPKEAYQKEIIPAFQKKWKEKTGQDVKFSESYVGSGAQAKAIASGLEADVAALSLEGDIDVVTKAGLITHDWKAKQQKGMITRSVVAFGVKKGNPKGIKDWEDLAKPGVAVLYPSPRTSGGAMWDVNAIYGGGLKKSEGKSGTPDKQAAKELLANIQKNVKVMDKSGRESMTTFEKGLGDVVVTYENELLLRNMESPIYDIIYPNATILIENPVALVDKNVDKHGNREVVEAFVDFLWSKEAQEAFAKYGFRSVDPEVAEANKAKFPQPSQLFTIDYLGGWPKVLETLYGPNGVWTEVAEQHQ
ncbi:sulfate ABC transporter substrate-binding protein [Heliobacillus mobilis]|uniref:Sulfate ABC transporter substrate-binding protein n=1 Tax=Heliobacterium mobile TaxID=28064 RepID=A0A6I3SHE4_HELMO|nr:sulfate ABC transporter substrate-binding protein [Heliobacterium mobile]MTV48225.1 sulfate ABC transporter substrate-binding protein [Heliobacterium mobile]